MTFGNVLIAVAAADLIVRGSVLVWQWRDRRRARAMVDRVSSQITGLVTGMATFGGVYHATEDLFWIDYIDGLHYTPYRIHRVELRGRLKLIGAERSPWNRQEPPDGSYVIARGPLAPDTDWEDDHHPDDDPIEHAMRKAGRVWKLGPGAEAIVTSPAISSLPLGRVVTLALVGVLAAILYGALSALG